MNDYLFKMFIVLSPQVSMIIPKLLLELCLNRLYQYVNNIQLSKTSDISKKIITFLFFTPFDKEKYVKTPEITAVFDI